MAKDIIITESAPQSPMYSQAVRAGGLLFVSGQGPYNVDSGAIVGSTIQEQTAQCLRNVVTILESAGSSLDSIVSVTFILLNPEDFAGFNEEWAKWFPENKPARQGAQLPVRIAGQLVSIAVIAEA